MMGPASHRPRPGAWSPAVILPALAALAAVVAGYALGAAWPWNVAWTASAVSAVAAMTLGRRAAEADDRELWTCWVAACFCWLLGQIGWNVFAVAGTPRSPNLADLGWWSFAALVVVALVRLPTSPSRTARMVAVVEALPLIVAAMALTFAELWPAADASPLDPGQRLSALLYPAFYVSAAIVTLQAMVGGSLRHVRGPGARLVLAGIMAQAVGFVAWCPKLLAGTYVPGHFFADPLWVVGLLSIGAGGLVAARTPGRGARPAEREETSTWGGALPAGVFLLLVAELVKAQVGGAPMTVRLTLAIGLFFCGASLIARGTLLEIRLRSLLARERGATERLTAREAELAQLNERLLQDARRDALTGLRNRRALAEDLPLLEARGGPFAVVLCDVDCFKAYNDHVGHLAGDRALRAIAAAARSQLRTGDAAYRYGGEELLIVLRDADAASAMAVAERIRAAVRRTAIAHPAGVAPVLTVSAGVAAGSGDGAVLLARADAALYAAKHAGRDRVLAASEEHEPTPPRAVDCGEDTAGRQLRGILAVARAGVREGEPVAVLAALGDFIRSELRYQTVAANLRDAGGTRLEVVHVLGDDDVRAALLGTSGPLAEWERALERSTHPSGAVWLPKGSHEWTGEVAVWTPAAGALGGDAWDPEDMLLLPLRDSRGELLAVVSVDEPLHGARPDDAELATLMAAADHAALALEQIAVRAYAGPAASRTAAASVASS